MSGNVQQMPTYAVNLCLEGSRVLVVGAGAVARRKISGLLAAGASVSVVAPVVLPEITAWSEEGRISLHRRQYRSGEAGQYRLVFSATGVPVVDGEVTADARAAGVMINVADVPELCDFYLPAVVSRGHLKLSLTTDGRAPFGARRLREMLERQIGPGFTEWVIAAGQFREAVRTAIDDPARREALFDRYFEATIVGPADDAAESDARVLDPETWRAWLEEAGDPSNDRKEP